MHWRPPGWELWEGWGHWPSPPRPFSGPHGTGDAAPEAAGHTHCPLVPARLAGVLEAGKLAVPAGPAVLVNDALLGGSLERQVSEPAVSGKGNSLFVPQSRPHRLRAQEQSPDAPQCPSTPSPAQLAPGVQPPTSTQAGRALTHSAHPSFCPVGCRA